MERDQEKSSWEEKSLQVGGGGRGKDKKLNRNQHMTRGTRTKETVMTF